MRMIADKKKSIALIIILLTIVVIFICRDDVFYGEEK